MKLYKFKDLTDGRFAFVLARSKTQAECELKKHTTLKFEFVDFKHVEELEKPIIMFNKILPF